MTYAGVPASAQTTFGANNIGAHLTFGTGIFTAPSTGEYSFGSSIQFNSLNILGDRRVQIRVQGSYNSNIVQVNQSATSSSYDGRLIISVDSIHLVVNDTVRIQVFQNGAASISLIGLGGRFGGHRVA